MDSNRRLRELMKEWGLSMYMLSKMADLSPTTVQNMMARNTQPTVPTLEAICKALGISLAQFFQEGDELILNDEQKELLDAWALLSPKKREALFQVIRLMNDNLYN